MNTRTVLALALSCHLLAFTPGARGQVYEKVFDFGPALAEDFANSPNKGRAPAAALVQGIDGNFYGTTVFGGANGAGTVFRMTASGELTTLVEFTGFGASNKGTSPIAALVQRGDGNFYGTTQDGGSNDLGTVFRMTLGGVLTTLVEFTGNSGTHKGESPRALVQGSDGNFYGTTIAGGANDLGTVFRMTPAGELTTLVEFTGTGGTHKGESPLATLVQGSDGNFYGATLRGGSNDLGTVFRMTAGGVLTTLVEFTGAGGTHQGSNPYAALVQGSDGDFYGTTSKGGANDLGTVFRMTVGGELTTLVEFAGTGGTHKGSNPNAALVQGSDGNFYGTTENGGANDFGTVFRMTAGGELTTLAEFTGTGGTHKGDRPFAALVQGSDGNFYGTAVAGGANNEGTVFRMTAGGELTTLVEFTGKGASTTGSNPYAALVQDGDGNFYGTTWRGGANDLGTVFRMTPTGVPTTLVAFTGQDGPHKGESPLAALVQGSDGNFYGTTERGGANGSVIGSGTVFRMTPGGVLTTLVEFTGQDGPKKGESPSAALVLGSDGNFYGTTREGGANFIGTVFRMTPGGVLTTLVEFTGNGGANKGRFPYAALVQGSDGNFYGTTSEGGVHGLGTVFRMTAGGELTTLVEFTGNGATNKGGFPRAALAQGSDGDFYGTTRQGGASDHGTVFRMTAGGELTTLAEFTGNGVTDKGRLPSAALVQGSDGDFYGTTAVGGTSDLGTVFRMTTGGVLTTLVEFEDANFGIPLASLLQAADGNFYGTVSGPAGGVFRLITPGMPSVFSTSARVQGASSALLEARINPRGTSTVVMLEYGTDGTNFPNSVTVASNLTGFQTQLVGTTLAALEAGVTYSYRFRAASSAGTMVSPAQSFSTLLVPVVTTSPASDLAPTSARFNGTVNARSFDTSVVFEWGTDGNSFPNTAPAVPGTVTGNTDTPVSAAVGGLPQGGPVYFRVRATNVEGTVISGARGFNTGLGVTTTALGDSDVGVSDVLFKATVNTFGQTVAVKFKYWADAAPGTVFETATQAVTSNGPVEVSARVSGLLENVAYSYRVSVELAGTETDGGAVAFTTDTNVAPVAMADVIFYTGQVQFDPLANDSDGNGDALVLDPVLAVPPTVAAAVASVTADRLFISYNPQNNVSDEDTLTYRVLDPQGASATAVVRLIAFSKRAGFYSGRADVSGGAVVRSGAVSLQFGTSGAMTTAFFNWAGESYRLKGVFDPSGRLTRTIELVNFAGHTLTMTLQLDPDAALIHGSVVERDAGNAIVASVPDFTLVQNAGTGGLPEAGVRTAFLSAPASLAGQMGDGYVVMTVAKNRRSARFAGQLPDGEPFLASAAAQGRSFALSDALERGGVLVGLVREVGTDTDAAGVMANLFWKKRASTRSRFFRGAIGTNLELLGMEYPALGRSALPPIELGSGTPNARLRFSGGDLTSALDIPLHIGAGSVSGFDASQVKRLKLDVAAGRFSGKFLHPAAGRFIPFGGAFRTGLDIEPGQGRGVFRGPSAAGSVRIEAP